MVTQAKVTLVGESNPYGGDDYYALYPAPDGCSGHRLCCLILGMDPDDYLEAFGRVNLVRGGWSVRAAREAAARLDGRLILLGSKVCAAFGLEFKPFHVAPSRPALVLPHPSGLCRLWQQPGAVECARRAVSSFCPEIAHLLGPITEGVSP